MVRMLHLQHSCRLWWLGSDGNGEYGGLIEPESIDPLEKEIMAFLESPSRRQTIAVKARDRIVQDYSFRARMEKVAAIYHAILNTSR